MHICNDACTLRCSARRRPPVFFGREPVQKMEFISEDDGNIQAHVNSLFMGRWFHNKQEGTFRLPTGGTGYVKKLTDWLNLMQDGQRV